MISRLSLNNEKKEEFDIIPEKYYWVFYNESYKIAKIKEIKTNNVVEYILNDIQYVNKTFQITELSDKVFSTKDKTIFKYFDNSQINPENYDLATVYLISYPVLLYNFKFKVSNKFNLTSAGKLFIGINLNHELICNLNYSNRDMLTKITDNIQLNYLQQSTDQTIIINGGSFTGKTVLAKHIWRTLLSNDLFKKHLKEQDNLKEFERILKINEEFVSLFGNAVVGENKNSSRYLKLFKVYLHKFNNKFPHFTKIKSKYYLFEKNRIFNSQNYDNYYIFHIFHAILEGFHWILNSDSNEVIFSIFKDPLVDKEIISLIKDKYGELIEFNDIFRKKYNNLTEEYNNKYLKIYMDNFIMLLSCVKNLNLTMNFLNHVFKFIFCIFMIMELEFSVDQEGKAYFDRKPEDKDYLHFISVFLECDIEILKKRLISREIRSPRGSFYIVKFTLEEAIRAKHGLIKYLYENLFNYITNLCNLTINNFLRKKVLKIGNLEEYNKIIKSSNFIQIVEYFGFENSEKPEENTLENLFINYTNDKLSNLLFEISIRNEAELYFNEGIISEEYMKSIISKNKDNDKPTTTTNRAGGRLSISKSNVNKNNQDIDIDNTILSCEDNTKGIFKLLDVQSSIARGSFKALCDNIKLSWPNVITTTNSFYLMHFGEMVEYGATDFIQKNIDSINDDLKEISNKQFKKMTENISDKLSKDMKKNLIKNFSSSQSEENKKPETSEDKSSSSVKTLQKQPESTRRISQNMKLKSNSEKFKQTINKLIYSIKKTHITFIKLTKTTQNQIDTNNFDEKYVLKQIYASGILESIIIAKGGFFLRYPYEKLKKELTLFSRFNDFGNDSEFNKMLANFLKINEDEFVMGKNLIFLKNSALMKNKELLNFSNIASVVRRKLLKSLIRKGYFTHKIYKMFVFIMNKKRYENFYSLLNKCFENVRTKFFYTLLYENLQHAIYLANKIKKNFIIYRARKNYKRLRDINKFLSTCLIKKILEISKTYLVKILKFNFLFEKKMEKLHKYFYTRLKKVKSSKKMTTQILKSNTKYIFGSMKLYYHNFLLKRRIAKKMIKTYLFRNFTKKLVHLSLSIISQWTFLLLKKDLYLKKCQGFYYLSKLGTNFKRLDHIVKTAKKYEKASDSLQYRFNNYFFKEFKIEMRLQYRFKKLIYKFISHTSKKIKASKHINSLFDRLLITNYYNNIKVFHFIRNRKAKILTKFLLKSRNKLVSTKDMGFIFQNCQNNYLFSLFYINFKLKYLYILNNASKKLTRFIRKANFQLKASKKLNATFSKKIQKIFLENFQEKVKKLMLCATIITKALRVFSLKSKGTKLINNSLEAGIYNNKYFYYNLLKRICFRIKKARQIIKFLTRCRDNLKFTKLLFRKLEICLKDIFRETSLEMKAFHYIKINSIRKIVKFLKYCRDLFNKVKNFQTVFSKIYLKCRKDDFLNNLINFNLKYNRIAKAIEIMNKIIILQKSFDQVFFKSQENLIKKALFIYIKKLRRNNNFLKLHSILSNSLQRKRRITFSKIVQKCFFKIRQILFINKNVIKQIKLYSKKNVLLRDKLKELILQESHFNLIEFITHFKLKFILFIKLQKEIKSLIARMRHHRLLLSVQCLIMKMKRKIINFCLRQLGMLVKLDHERLYPKKEENNNVENNKESSSPVTKQKSSTSTTVKNTSTKNVLNVRTNSSSKNKPDTKKGSSNNIPKISGNSSTNNSSKNTPQKPSNIKPPKIPVPSSNIDIKISPKKNLLPPTDPKVNILKPIEDARPTRKTATSGIHPGSLHKSSSKSKLNSSFHNPEAEKNLNDKIEKKSEETKNASPESQPIKKKLERRSNSTSNLNRSMNAAIKKYNDSIIGIAKPVKKHKSVNYQNRIFGLFSRSFENFITKGEEFTKPVDKKLNVSAHNIESKNGLDVEEKAKPRPSKVQKTSSFKENQKKSELNKLNKKVKDCDKEIEELESEIINFKMGSLKDEYENNKSKIILKLERIEVLAKNQKQKIVQRRNSLRQESNPNDLK